MQRKFQLNRLVVVIVVAPVSLYFMAKYNVWLTKNAIFPKCSPQLLLFLLKLLWKKLYPHLMCLLIIWLKQSSNITWTYLRVFSKRETERAWRGGQIALYSVSKQGFIWNYGDRKYLLMQKSWLNSKVVVFNWLNTFRTDYLYNHVEWGNNCLSVSIRILDADFGKFVNQFRQIQGMVSFTSHSAPCSLLKKISCKNLKS